MATNYKYQYQPRKKYLCPNCGHKSMKRFMGTTTGELLDESYGVCERMFSCGYAKRPHTEKVETVPTYQPPKIPFFFKPETMAATLNRYQNNMLFLFLCKVFNPDAVKSTFDKYKIGTSDWGDTIFWQINHEGRIVAGKKIQYFSNGKRNKARGASWLHNANGFDLANNELAQALFGSHLIDSATEKIYVVESEKTALICDIVKKDKNTVFVATGGLQNLGLIAKLKTNGAPVICIPDNDANEIWKEKIIRLALNCKISLIPALQSMEKGSDVGDFVLLFQQQK